MAVGSSSAGYGSKVPAIGVIGCGAIAELFHLPALTSIASIKEKLVLVDLDIDRARKMADRFGIQKFTSDFSSIIGSVDGAIVATPPRSHFPIALKCIRSGIHVLCEKPLAETVPEVMQLADEAERSGVVVMVNNTRRLFPSTIAVRSWIREGKLGRLRSIEFHQGEKFDWPSAGDSYFGIGGSGKGVLSDVGAHVVDLVCWWLGDRPRITAYQDDSFGGTEAVARLELEHEGCVVTIHLSWLSKLKNLYRIQGEVASIEGEMHDYRSFTVMERSGKPRKIRASRGPATYAGFADILIRNFTEVINYKERPVVGIKDILPSIGLIEECYNRRSRFEMPWFSPKEGHSA